MTHEQSPIHLQAFLLGAMVAASHARSCMSDCTCIDDELQRIFACAQKVLTSRKTLQAISTLEPRDDLERLACIIRGSMTIDEAIENAQSGEEQLARCLASSEKGFSDTPGPLRRGAGPRPR
jgi:hypothetical protein